MFIPFTFNVIIWLDLNLYLDIFYLSNLFFLLFFFMTCHFLSTFFYDSISSSTDLSAVPLFSSTYVENATIYYSSWFKQLSSGKKILNEGERLLYPPTCLLFIVLLISFQSCKFPSDIIFFLPKETIFNISDIAGMLVTNSLSFVYPPKSLFCLHFQIFFARDRFPDWVGQFFVCF